MRFPAARCRRQRQPVTASSSAAGSSPNAAVDRLAYTSWTASDEKQPWITIDLGADVSFRRVMLKQLPGGGIRNAKLQTSEDDVVFKDILDAESQLKRTTNITFRSVLARFVRVQVKEFKGRAVGFEEISVSPE